MQGRYFLKALKHFKWKPLESPLSLPSAICRLDYLCIASLWPGGLAVVFIDYTHKCSGKASARCVGLLGLSRDLGAVSALL